MITRTQPPSSSNYKASPAPSTSKSEPYARYPRVWQLPLWTRFPGFVVCVAGIVWHRSTVTHCRVSRVCARARLLPFSLLSKLHHTGITRITQHRAAEGPWHCFPSGLLWTERPSAFSEVSFLWTDTCTPFPAATLWKFSIYSNHFSVRSDETSIYTVMLSMESDHRHIDLYLFSLPRCTGCVLQGGWQLLWGTPILKRKVFKVLLSSMVFL